MNDKTWLVSIGSDTGEVFAPDPVEAATRYLEEITSTSDRIGIGILMKVHDVFSNEDSYIRSVVVLANAGMHSTAASIKKFYNLKAKKS